MMLMNSRSGARSMPPLVAARGDADLCALVVLRDVELSGPRTGLESLNGVAPTLRALGARQPGYPILHELVEAGLLAASGGTPPLYRITDAGRREAERLARECLPRLSGEVEQLRSRLVRVLPRGSAAGLASEWADERFGRLRLDSW